MNKSLLPKVSEHEIQTAIINYLRYRGYWVQRMNSGVIPATYGGKTRMIRMSAKGMPDIMAFKQFHRATSSDLLTLHNSYINLLFIEVKKPGKKQTPAQAMMMKELESFGARCFVATSVEDVEKCL